MVEQLHYEHQLVITLLVLTQDTCGFMQGGKYCSDMLYGPFNAPSNELPGNFGFRYWFCRWPCQQFR